jgi:hypothetical protein
MNFDSTSDLKIVPVLSTEVNNRLVGPDEILRVIDTGALYVAGPGGKPQAMMTATTTSDGVIRRSAGGVKFSPVGPIRDKLKDITEWMLPKHLPVLDPAQFIGMTTITSGALSATYQAGAGDFSRDALRIAASGAVTSTAVTLQLPAATEPGAKDIPATAAGALHMRIKCSDWSLVTRLYISLSNDGFTTQYIWIVADSGQSRYGCKDPAYASAWNGKYRTISIASANMTMSGAAAAWGTNARYFNFSGVRITLTSTAAVTLDIDRIYSPDWPAGVIAPIFDGSYQTARNLFMTEFVPRGWGAGFSANVMAQGSFYPEYADLVALSKAGADVFCHGHDVTGAGSVQPLTDSVTEGQYLLRLSQQRRALLAAGVHPAGLVWHQFLQDTGRYAGNFDMAGLLRSQGIKASRFSCSDATWGVNPFNSLITNAVTATDYETWLPYKGPYNFRGVTAFENIPTGGEYANPGVDTSKPTLKKRIEYTALVGGSLVMYNHNIIDPAGAYDVSVAFGRDLVAALAEKEAAGSLFIVNPTDLLRMTFLRRGDLYMRSDGEWAYRDDPTKIAF